MPSKDDNALAEQVEKLVNAKVHELSEHVDSIRIFVSFSDTATTTKSYTSGWGNFYGQIGQVREWLIRQDEFVREDARVEQREEE